MIYKNIIRPLLFTLPPELAHTASMAALKAGTGFLPLASSFLKYQNKNLEREVWGLKFSNPVGLAAGFDKHATCVDAWQHLGFGFEEIGTFTRHAQPGNPKPRVFRFPAQQALVNRFGFNNPGADVAAKRLGALKAAGRWPSIPVGINLGKSKITPLEDAAQDYLYSLQRLAIYADYITINVSSPNTPGLRKLQSPAALKKLVTQVARQCKNPGKNPGKNPAGKKIPLLVKLAPDMTDRQMRGSVDACLAGGARGLIATNTTISRVGVPGSEKEEGGLSGAPLRLKSRQWVQKISKWTGGRVAIIGVGGIFNEDDALQMLESGASLLQVYTGFIYEGPGLPSRLCRAIATI